MMTALKRGPLICLLASILLLAVQPGTAAPDPTAPDVEVPLAKKSEDELVAQAALIGALRAHLQSLSAKLDFPTRFGELRELLAKLAERTGEKTLVRDDLREIEGEIRGYSNQNLAYRDEYLAWVRLTAVGERYPELVTKLGRTYRDVVVRRVTEIGLEIRHADGTARLRYQVLGPEFQERFRWKASAAHASLRREARVDAERVRRAWIATRPEPVELVSRLDSSEPIETSELDASDPIETRRLHSSDRIVPLRLHSSGRISPASLEPSARIGRSSSEAP